MIEARLRSESGRLLGPPQHANHPAHLGERLPAGPLDDEQRLALALLVGSQQPSHRRRLDGHHADAVTDDVVKLARDPRSLLRDGCAGRSSRSRSARAARSFASSASSNFRPSEKPTTQTTPKTRFGEDEVANAAVRDRSERRMPSAPKTIASPATACLQSRSSAIRKTAAQPGEEGDEVVGTRRSSRSVVRDDRERRQRRARQTGTAVVRESGAMIARSEQHVEPERTVRPVATCPGRDDGHRNPAGDPGDDQDVEPVAPGQAPEPFHASKVLR